VEKTIDVLVCRRFKLRGMSWKKKGGLMKVTRLETVMVRPWTMFLKMHTDEGIVGYGEPILEGHAHSVATAVRQFEQYLLGKDPRRILHHWQAMYRSSFYRGCHVLLSAISGIEQAMWDILCKHLNIPIYQLLGGACRDRVRVYSHISGRTAQEYVQTAHQKVAAGFTALKYAVPCPVEIVDNKRYIDECVALMSAIREAVGDSIDIAVDFHGRLSPAMAKLLIRELVPFHPFFIEEPCLPENVDALVDIARSTSVPIATGERLVTKWQFREILEKRAAVILQPDVSHVGGIAQLRDVASMAEVYYAGIAPHCPLGPIALAASIQVDAAVPNFLIQEQITLGEGYLVEPFKLSQGYVEIPKKPGLGIELNEQFVAESKYDGNWTHPIVYHEDGSVADR
jgi:galactonate dehydratase